MGVYIKGIEMPKNCFDCEIFGLCSLKDRLEHIEDRNPDCPLVEIPTPHGRLIAEGSITDQLQEIEDITALSNIDLGEEPYDDTDEIMLPISTIRKILDRCITILEAEE